MKKYVYLFELDSVRKTDQEIINAQKALYNEIVANGNIVVLTYNQLVDSRGFFSLLDNADYYNNIISLFENGAIKISQYGSIKTVSQYLLNTIDDPDNCFFYSALPVKYSQKRLTALMKRSLMYSDLSEIYGYIDGIFSSENELRDLFIEIKDGEPYNSSLSLISMKEILENLCGLLKTVLRLSAQKDIYIPPKAHEEYKHLHFSDILKIILSLDCHGNELWTEAISVIKQLKCYGKDSRSPYTRELTELKANRDPSQINALQYAEAIINLCYNYTCELSICNISKHYNVSELENTVSERPTFSQDFFSRLNQDWRLGEDASQKYLQDESNDYQEFKLIDKIPDFSKAVRLTKYSLYTERKAPLAVPRYEFDIQKQKKAQKLLIIKQLFVRLKALLAGLFSIIVLQIIFALTQSLLDGEYSMLQSISSSINFGIKAIVFFVLGELITSLISAKFPKLLSFSEAINGIGKLISDSFSMLFSKQKTYVNTCTVNLDFTEKCCQGARINYYETVSLKQYKRLINEHSPLFTENLQYPIADVNDTEVIKRLDRLEELFNYKFGLVYKSRFNQLVVDPICGSANGYYPYERILSPLEKGGVVIIPMHKGNFVLLRQFRHAPRKEQYCFPRGFAENDLSSLENVKKELNEEIGAKISKEPIKIGKIIPDSGLISQSADVFVIEIDDFSRNNFTEGILNIFEISENELRDYISKQIIDDGFTLGAYTLYKNSKHYYSGMN